MSVVLNNGRLMPQIGLGTHKVVGRDVIQVALCAALEAGYRSVDTASSYKNETDIGSVLPQLMQQYSLERKDLFITSKLAPKDHGCGKCRAACLKSLRMLGLDYLDLYLIHWPGASGMRPEDTRHEALRMESWRDLEQLYDEGVLKAIGVSNYRETHLLKLLSACRIRPSVLQVECHPQLIQMTLRDLCRQNSIHFQAYSSLGSSSPENDLLTNTEVRRIASECSRTEAQVLLRWAVQQGIGVIPKSVNRQRILENIDIFNFSLTSDQMIALEKLNVDRHYCWNPCQVA